MSESRGIADRRRVNGMWLNRCACGRWKTETARTCQACAPQRQPAGRKRSAAA